MKTILSFITSQPTDQQVAIALVFMRVGLGILSIGHGFPKIVGSVDQWKWLGAAMAPMGITFLPVMWGILAALSEFLGGILFTVGLGTRIVSFFLAMTMVVATIWHISKKDPFMTYSFPLTLVIVFLAFVIMGGGNYSVDQYLAQQKTEHYEK